MPGRPDRALASMGIYVFDAAFLYEVLLRDADDPRSCHDFGKDVIPRLIAEGTRTHAHDFAASCVNTSDGVPYWRDVGTIDAYWEANVALTDVVPELNLYDQDWPIWTYQEQLPPAKFVFDDDGRRGTAIDSIVASGCIISGSIVRRSLLFSNVHVHDYCDDRGFGGPAQRRRRPQDGAEAGGRRQALPAAAGLRGRGRSGRGPAAFSRDRTRASR